MSSGERPIGAARGTQPNTEALCQTPPPPNCPHGIPDDRGGGSSREGSPTSAALTRASLCYRRWRTSPRNAASTAGSGRSCLWRKVCPSRVRPAAVAFARADGRSVCSGGVPGARG